MVSGATPVLHNHRVDQLPTGHAASGANVIGFPALYEIHRIEWIDRVHETMYSADRLSDPCFGLTIDRALVHTVLDCLASRRTRLCARHIE